MHRVLWAIALSFFFVASACAQPQQVAPGFTQTPERISQHVQLLRQGRIYFYDPVGNVTVIEQSDGLVLVDSGGYFGSGQRVVETVRRLSPKPVKAVILTHYHSDHSLGVSAIVRAWPHVRIIANAATIALMTEGRPPNVPREPSPAFEAQRQERLRRSFGQIADQMAAQTDMSAAERAGWTAELATLPTRLADVPGTYTVLPNESFTERLSIPDRDAPVEVLFLGRANTAGDTLVWIPGDGVLATGDIVVQPIPYMFDSFPGEMLGVFDRIINLHPRVIIPGHGSPQSIAYVQQLRAFVDDVRTQVTPLARGGATAEEIAAQTDFARERTAFAGDDPWLGYWFQGYALDPLIDSVSREARGERLGVGPVSPPPQ